MTIVPANASPGLRQALLGHEPTGVNLRTGQPVWRTFATKNDWVNHAATWMRSGDVCFDADGRQLRMGKDFDGCRYPVTIARPKR